MRQQPPGTPPATPASPEESVGGGDMPPHRSAPAVAGWRPGAFFATLGCLTGAVIFATGGLVAGALGFGIACVLVMLAIPILGFTSNQILLTTRGQELVRSVDDVRVLKASDAAAFTQPFAALLRRAPEEQVRRRHDRDRLASGPPGAERQLAGRSPHVSAHVTGSATSHPAVSLETHLRRPLSHPPDDRGLGRNHDRRHSVPSWEHSRGRPVVRSFWGCLSDVERRALGKMAREQTFPAGTALFQEGQPADHLMVIRTGRVKVCVDEAGRERIIVVRGRGDLVGERAALRVSSRSATVIALDTVRALVVRTEDFAAFLQAHPAVLEVVEDQVYGRLVEDRGRPPVPAWSGHNCSVFYTDIAGFGAHNRTDRDRRVVRQVMYEVLQEAFEGSGVPWAQCHSEDRGDGSLVIVPHTFPTGSVVDPLLALLAAGLRRHDHHSKDATRIQLRAALHVGPVESDPHGVTGEAIIHTARLLEAPPLKRRLAATASHLGFIASTFVYNSVIKHAPGHVDPSTYQRVRFKVKESTITAWTYLTGLDSPTTTG